MIYIRDLFHFCSIYNLSNKKKYSLSQVSYTINDLLNLISFDREKYEAVVERDARRQQLNSIGHNHSRDSAIDADLQEWETETLEIELVCVIIYN